VEKATHPSTRHYPASFVFTDEWYAFKRNPRGSVRVLLTIDESTYAPGTSAMGDHPIAWYHLVGRGRSWYTNMGHRSETYDDPAFERHLLGGIHWAAARGGQTPIRP
jgi:type 1 glutamine amidotransferase